MITVKDTGGMMVTGTKTTRRKKMVRKERRRKPQKPRKVTPIIFYG